MTPRLAGIAGITLYMQPVQDLTVESRVSRTQYQYTLEDTNAAELADWTPKMVEKLRGLPEVLDVASDQGSGSLQADLVVDRDTASRLGVTPQMIDDTLYDAFGQRQVSTIFTQLNQYHVVLQLEPQFQLTPESLQHIYVHASPGGAAAPAAGGSTGGGAVGAAASSQTASTSAGSSSSGANGPARPPRPLR